nr:hypothetical protein [Psychrobacter sp. PraFG1]UNK05478.1 hypothetical protein MN210_00575 [Psychrobacter sp. PraFG1]
MADDFYIHSNANNLAILPKGIHKRHAVAYLLEQHLDHARPSFGFGDSLADLPFCSSLIGTAPPIMVNFMTTFMCFKYSLFSIYPR